MWVGNVCGGPPTGLPSDLVIPGPLPPRGPTNRNGVSPMLVTILIILAIVALAIFILSRVRGGRRGL